MALWDAIHLSLAEEIAAGTYPPGSRLPGEMALARRFGVNRHTVRRALARLVEDGRIHVRRGAGATVLPPPIEYGLGQRTRFSDALQGAGRRPGRRRLRLETVPATAADAAVLAIAEGAPVCVLETVGTADGVPVMTGQHRLPAERLPGIEAALAARLRDGEAGAEADMEADAATARVAGISAALAACGVADYRRGETRITAAVADAILAQRLMVAPGAPLIGTRRLDLDPAGRPVNHGESWMVAERITLVVRGAGVMSPEGTAASAPRPRPEDDDRPPEEDRP